MARKRQGANQSKAISVMGKQYSDWPWPRNVSTSLTLAQDAGCHFISAPRLKKYDIRVNGFQIVN